MAFNSKWKYEKCMSRRRPRFVDDTELGSFLVVVWQMTAKKCSKIYNVRAQLLFGSLNLCLATFSLPSSSWSVSLLTT